MKARHGMVHRGPGATICGSCLRILVALGLAAGAAATLAITPSASTNQYRQVGLPGGVGILQGIACPSNETWYAVGSSDPGAAGIGLIVTSHDRGKTWSKSLVTGTADLAGISCPAEDQCTAVGTAAGPRVQAAVAATKDGRSWRPQAAPAGASPLYRVTCPSSSGCLAVGNFSQNLQPQAVIATTDGGAKWTSRSLPTVAIGPPSLFSVSCADQSHCWAAGSGVWATGDFGATWIDRSPPQPFCPAGQRICDLSYSLLDGISFVDNNRGWVVGGIQCGGVGRTRCPSEVTATADGGRHWSTWRTSDTSTFPFVDDVSCRDRGCVAVAQTFTSSVLMATADGAHWVSDREVKAFLNAAVCVPDGGCFAVGQSGNRAIILTSASLDSPARAFFSLSLLDPRDVSTDPRLLASNGLAAFLVALLIIFPSNLFNATLAANYEETMGWLGPIRLVGRRTAGFAGRLPARLRLALFLSATAVIAGLLDPGFGLNLHSVPIFAGMLAALTFGTLFTGRLGAFYVRWRMHLNHHLRIRPAGLLVAVACVAISRAAHFSPGYLYGVISGPQLERDLNARDEGQTLAFTFAATFFISIAAWLTWIPVKWAADQTSLVPFIALDVLLAAIFVGGIEGILFGLIPVRFQPGEKLRRWNWPFWLCMLLVSLFTLFHVLLRPRPTSNLTPFVTVFTLFLLFGGASVAFWAYFRFRKPPRHIDNPRHKEPGRRARVAERNALSHRPGGPPVIRR